MPYTQEPQPLQSERVMTELDVFEKIFDEIFFEQLVRETNSNAHDLLNKREKPGRLENWYDVNVPEMTIFIAMILWMGINVMRTIDHYFMQHKFFKNEYMQNLMSGKRFTNILSILRYSPHHNSVDTSQKIKPLVKYCQNKWKSLFQSRENILIDESIASFKGRIKYKQFCKDKKKK